MYYCDVVKWVEFFSIFVLEILCWVDYGDSCFGYFEGKYGLLRI